MSLILIADNVYSSFEFIAASILIHDRLFTIINAAPPLFTGAWRSAIWVGLAIELLTVALTRYGLVTLASAYFVVNALINFPVTLNFSVWYAGTALLPLLAILALAAFSFYTSLAGQKLLAEKLLEE